MFSGAKGLLSGLNLNGASPQGGMNMGNMATMAGMGLLNASGTRVGAPANVGQSVTPMLMQAMMAKKQQEEKAAALKRADLLLKNKTAPADRLTGEEREYQGGLLGAAQKREDEQRAGDRVYSANVKTEERAAGQTLDIQGEERELAATLAAEKRKLDALNNKNSPSGRLMDLKIKGLEAKIEAFKAKAAASRAEGSGTTAMNTLNLKTKKIMELYRIPEKQAHAVASGSAKARVGPDGNVIVTNVITNESTLANPKPKLSQGTVPEFEGKTLLSQYHKAFGTGSAAVGVYNKVAPSVGASLADEYAAARADSTLLRQDLVQALAINPEKVSNAESERILEGLPSAGFYESSERAAAQLQQTWKRIEVQRNNLRAEAEIAPPRLQSTMMRQVRALESIMDRIGAPSDVTPKRDAKAAEDILREAGITPAPKQ